MVLEAESDKQYFSVIILIANIASAIAAGILKAVKGSSYKKKKP